MDKELLWATLITSLSVAFYVKAHLYYLREKNKIKAHLLFIYFINDVSVYGPKTKDEWLGAIQTMECYLGLAKNYKLRKYIHDIFIDVNDLR